MSIHFLRKMRSDIKQRVKPNKGQSILILGSIALFCFIYFGMNLIPKEQRILEKTRAENIEVTGIQNIIMDAKKKLSRDQINIIEALQIEYQNAASDEDKVSKAKNLASRWYEFQSPIVSGYYAEQIAEMENTAASWSITGTTYSLGMKASSEMKFMQFARGRAISAFEKAISLKEGNVDDQINLALIYVDHPTASPMEGIQMLLKLNKNNPDNVQVINQLARLAIRTNQIDKAIVRLEKALTLEPENNNSICLIAEAYSMAGKKDKATEFENKCKK